MDNKSLINIFRQYKTLALGCWAFGGDQWGGQDDNDSFEAIDKAIELGVNHFDTARAYGNGRSERICGEALKKVRKDLFLATKFCYWPGINVENELIKSLLNMQTDYIDLLYIHWPKKGADMRSMMQDLEKARKKEIIKYIGVSNFSIDQMKQVMEAGTIDACQLCYNLLWRWDEKDIIPFCIQNNIAIITYSSIAQGILTGKFPLEISFKENDARNSMILFSQDVWPLVHDTVDKMKNIVKKDHTSLVHYAVNWIKEQEGISSILFGARNALQIDEIIQSESTESNKNVLMELTRLSDQIHESLPNTGNIFQYYP